MRNNKWKREALNDIGAFKQKLKRIEQKVRGEQVTVELIQKLENLAKNAFYQSFSPAIKDKFRPAITYDAEAVKFIIDIKRKNER